MAHTGESLLRLLRYGSVRATTPVAFALLALVDSIRQILPPGTAPRSDPVQSISTLWSKIPRFVAHLAQTCGRQVAVQLEEQGEVLEQSLIAAIRGPLLQR